MDDNNDFPSLSTFLTQINVTELQIGMYVSELDRPWLESSFLFQGFELKTKADIEAVQKQCDFVYIDVKKQSDSHQLKRESKTWIKSRKAPKKTSNFSAEFSYAQSVFHETSDLVKGFMENITLGRAINVEIAKKGVSACVQSIMKSPDALMWFTQLKERDEYTSQHSMNVCILSIALGRQLDLPEKDLEELYPPGNIVEMSNGEVAVIIEVNSVKKLKPKVTMLLNEDKQRVKPRLVDMAKMDLDPTGSPYQIKRMIRPEKYDLDMNMLYKMGVVQASTATQDEKQPKSDSIPA